MKRYIIPILFCMISAGAFAQEYDSCGCCCATPFKLVAHFNGHKTTGDFDFDSDTLSITAHDGLAQNLRQILDTLDHFQFTTIRFVEICNEANQVTFAVKPLSGIKTTGDSVYHFAIDRLMSNGTMVNKKDYCMTYDIGGALVAPGSSQVLPYKVYTALLDQDSTDAPVATVLDNTTGGPVNWIFDSNGNYYSDSFIGETNVMVIGGDPQNQYSSTRVTWTGVFVTIEQAGLASDYDPIPMNTLVRFPIEIRVYP